MSEYSFLTLIIKSSTDNNSAQLRDLFTLMCAFIHECFENILFEVHREPISFGGAGGFFD